MSLRDYWPEIMTVGIVLTIALIVVGLLLWAEYSEGTEPGVYTVTMEYFNDRSGKATIYIDLGVEVVDPDEVARTILCPIVRADPVTFPLPYILRFPGKDSTMTNIVYDEHRDIRGVLKDCLPPPEPPAGNSRGNRVGV